MNGTQLTQRPRTRPRLVLNAERWTDYRRASKHTYASLSEALGISYNTIKRIERDEIEPSSRFVAAVQTRLRLPMASMFSAVEVEETDAR